MNERISTLKTILSIVAIGLVVLLGIGYIYTHYMQSKSSSSTGTYVPVVVTPENLPAYLSSQSIIKDLPATSKVTIYVGDQVYGIEEGAVTHQAVSGSDVTVHLPERYFEIMGKYGLCTAIKTANANKELGIEYGASSASLGWKYRSLLKYKKCLG